MPEWRGDGLTGGDVPDPGRAVLAGRDPPAPVGAERGAVQALGVGERRGDRLPGARVPHPGRAVEAGRDDVPAARVEGRVIDIRGRVLQGPADRLARVHVPDLSRAVPRYGRQAAALRA